MQIQTSNQRKFQGKFKNIYSLDAFTIDQSRLLFSPAKLSAFRRFSYSPKQQRGVSITDHRRPSYFQYRFGGNISMHYQQIFFKQKLCDFRNSQSRISQVCDLTSKYCTCPCFD